MKKKIKKMVSVSIVGVFIVGFILSIMIISGCLNIATNTNISHKKPFSSYVGKEVVLLRGQNIIEKHRNSIKFKKYAMDGLGSTYNKSWGKVIMQLPVGKIIRINKVIKETQRGYSMVYAICSLRKSDGKILEFEYNLGGIGRLHRAPWEDKSIPTRRNY